MVETRTRKSLKNAQVALVFYCINLVLTFFSRKAFIVYLGIDVLGLNTIAVNLLSFLNLAELGIGTAISYTLYKPIYNKDVHSINEIVSVQGWLYRRIAGLVIVAGCVLMCFFPLIFGKVNLPLWYAYASFGVLLICSLLSYFINYRQIVLSADQREYKITLNVQGFKILKIVLQILSITYLAHGYVYWLVLELLFSLITAWGLNRILAKNYPWLKTSPVLGKELRKKYPEIITKTRQLFFHKIGAFALSQTSPLIIYAYSSLTLVAMYGNYMFVITGIVALAAALLNNVTAGIGNLVAEGNQKRIKSVFWELTSLRVWMASVFCFGMYRLAHSFITLWVGEGYVLEQSAFVALIAYTFILLTRTNDAFLSAYGLYQDIWAPVAEAVLNVGCSALLGYFFGLSGIVSGIVVSLVAIVCIWKPYFLYTKGFKEKINEYVMNQLKYALLIILSFIFSTFILDSLSLSATTFYVWIQAAIIVVATYAAISLLLFVLTDNGSRCFLRRVYTIVIQK